MTRRVEGFRGPRLAEWLLNRLSATSDERAIAGDLNEEFTRFVLPERGLLRARTWYWRQTIVSVAPLVRRRLARASGATRRSQPSWGGILADVRYASRALTKNAGTTGLAVVALALGIGIPTTMFSIVNGALRDLPFDEGQRLVAVSRNSPTRGWTAADVPRHDYEDWRRQQTAFEDLALFESIDAVLSGTEGQAELYRGAALSWNVFSLLRVRPMLGRGFQPSDATRNASVVILGYDLWTNRFGADSGIVGRTVRVNAQAMTVIGVMPDGFRFPSGHDAWIPFGDAVPAERGAGDWYRVLGRLADTVSLAQAQSEMLTISQRLALEHPETNEDVHARVSPYTESFLPAELRAVLFGMLASVSLVLVIACANVANLLLGRAARRMREVAVRTALGANRWRVMRQFLIEALVISALGAAVGVGLAETGVRFFNRMAGSDLVFWVDVRIDAAVLVFVVAASLLAAVLAGLAPALRASRADIGLVLKDADRGASGFRVGRLSTGLVVTEVMLSCALMVVAGLMVKGVTNLRTFDYPFEVERMFTANVELPSDTYAEAASRQAFFTEIEPALAGLPGVRSAALVTSMPARNTQQIRVAVGDEVYDRDQDHPIVHWSVVTPSFLLTFGAAVLEGRNFSKRDLLGAESVALVNQRFVDRFFSGENVLGRRIRLGTSQSTRPWRTIVGVVPDLHMTDIEEGDPNPSGIYVPLAQTDTRRVQFAVLVDGDPLALTSLVRDAVAAVDRDLPLNSPTSLYASILGDKWPFVLFGTLFSVFGAAALFLASVGLYGVMSSAVAARTKEVGIRMALGARQLDVLRLVLRQGLLQVVIGVALGVGLAVVMAPPLSTAFFHVDPRDLNIFGLTVGLLAFTGGLAIVLPARKAARVDPGVTLRYE